ncbi:hypothetical protein AVEN_154011-1 [Araneus ventricosus]|uniref:Uncharacterized protein n=1 Tax=Araneus ventricosus TaxID=182803 RepID=A0A4Y2MT54_ARAVE|nr:hypothetical protein AVEN_154011-1 [Araneus ventricosus]
MGLICCDSENDVSLLVEKSVKNVMTRYRKQFRSNKTRQQLCPDVSLKFHLTPKKTQGKLETSASDKSLSDAKGEQGESSEAGSVKEEGRFGGRRVDERIHTQLASWQSFSHLPPL